jgi:hypothetical protein
MTTALEKESTQLVGDCIAPFDCAASPLRSDRRSAQDARNDKSNL